MDVTAIIITVINGLLIPLIMWAVKEGAAYLKAKSNNEKLDGYISLVENAVQSVVADVSQSFVDEVKKNGEWNVDTAQEAAHIAYEEAKTLIGDKAMTGLNLLIGDAEEYIRARIEREVRINK